MKLIPVYRGIWSQSGPIPIMCESFPKYPHCANKVLQTNFSNLALIHIFRAAKNHTFSWTMFHKSTWVLPKKLNFPYKFIAFFFGNLFA